MTLSVEQGEKWLKINNNQVGYYRVNYTPSMWGDLTEQLKNNNQQVSRGAEAKSVTVKSTGCGFDPHSRK